MTNLINYGQSFKSSSKIWAALVDSNHVIALTNASICQLVRKLQTFLTVAANLSKCNSKTKRFRKKAVGAKVSWKCTKFTKVFIRIKSNLYFKKTVTPIFGHFTLYFFECVNHNFSSFFPLIRFVRMVVGWPWEGYSKFGRTIICFGKFAFCCRHSAEIV